MNTQSSKKTFIRSENIWPFILVTSLFFMWGMANNMTDTLLAAFKRIQSLTDFQTSWIQMAFYGAYFCLALPAAILIKKYTYKRGVLVGLGLFAFGSLLFYPASITMSYAHYLVALYILAGGCAILETSANPYIVALGPEDTGTQRLNLAQAFNPIGSLTGVMLSKVFILSQLNLSSAEERGQMGAEELAAIQSEELTAVTGPYLGVAAFLIFLWLVVKFTNMPKASDEEARLDLGPTFRRLLKTPHYVWAVVAQFFYIGAQIGIWSYTIRYVMDELQLMEDDASNYYMAAIVLFIVCRFLFTALMKVIKPRVLLMMTAFAAVGLTLVVIYGSGLVGVYGLVGISGCMSLMFPTIYGLGIRGLGDDTKIGGSGLIMAILGGAVLPMVQGQVSDIFGINFAFYVPLTCFLIIALYAFMEGRLEKANPQPHGDQEAVRGGQRKTKIA